MAFQSHLLKKNFTGYTVYR